MKIVAKFLNRSEEIVFDELSAVVSDNALRAFAKPRVSDVLATTNARLTDRAFNFYTRAHFDFVITDVDYKPVMAIEYDGPRHDDPQQIERDSIKDDLCRKAEFSLVRINANHVLRKFRGMTLLRWIVEVSQLECAFYEAQSKGQVPADELFDPAMFDSLGERRRFPYWLSVTSNLRIHDFLKLQDEPKGWHGFSGWDERDNIHRLEYVRFGNCILFAKTAIKQQNASFPIYDLADEVGICELGERIRLFSEGKIRSTGLDEFKAIHDGFHQRYRTGSSHGMGSGVPYRFEFGRRQAG